MEPIYTAVDWHSFDGNIYRGEVLSQSRTRARIRWDDTGHVTVVKLTDPYMRFTPEAEQP